MMSCALIPATVRSCCIRYFLVAVFAVCLLRAASARADAVGKPPADVFAGPVAVTGDASSGAYPTLRDAFAAINNGTHQGVITVSLQGDTTETASAVLYASGTGSSSYTSILIRPEGGARTISGVLAAPLIDLDGADNVTFDGRQDGAGSSLDLALENRNLSAPTLRFVNDASGNTFRYVRILGANTTDCASGAVGGVVFFGGTTGAAGNDSNIIEFGDIANAATGLPRFGICSFGVSGKSNSENVIRGNHIFNFWHPGATSAGMQIPGSSNTTSWIISDNDLYQTAARTASAAATHYAIQVGNGSGYTVTGNNIGGSAPDAQGAPWAYDGAGNGIAFIPVRLSVGATPVTGVQGNSVANIQLDTASSTNTSPGVFCGMHLAAGALELTGNTIGSAITAGSIAIRSASGSMTFGICSGTTSTQTISDNSIGGITVRGTSAEFVASLTGIGITSTGPATLDHNTIGSEAVIDSLNAASAATGSSGQSITGISRASVAGSITITDNTVAGLNNNYAGTATSGSQSRGIVIGNTSGTVIASGNRISAISSSYPGTGADLAASVIGLHVAAVNAISIEVADNIVHSLLNRASSAACHVVGVGFSGPNGGESRMLRNFVHSLHAQTSAPAATLTGMLTVGGAALFANNMVRLGVTPAGAAITQGVGLYGLRLNGGISKVYFNTVYIGGTDVGGDTATGALYRSSAGADSLLNNILINQRANGAGTGHHYAIWLGAATGLTPATCNYNLLEVGAGGHTGRLGGADYATLTDWQAGSACDAQGVAGAAPLINPGGPADVVDLHADISSALISPAADAGVSLASVGEDFDGSARSVTPDIGADEYTSLAADQLAGSYNGLTVGPDQVLMLADETTINGALQLGGRLLLGAHTLVLGPATMINGAPFSAQNMIVADDAGQVCRQFTAPGAFFFPIGDDSGTAEYAPVTLNLLSGQLAPGARMCVNTKNTAHPEGDQAHYATYLNRFWSVQQTGLSDFTCETTFQYTEADLVIATGESENGLYLWHYGGAWQRLEQVDAENNELTGSVTSFSDFTGRSAAPLAVALASLRAERQAACIKVAWETVSEVNTRGFYIYRAASSTELPSVPASPLIAAAPGATLGQAYDWLDCQVEPGHSYAYWLEEVAWDGARSIHGPVEITLDQPTAVAVQGLQASRFTLWGWLQSLRDWLLPQ